MNVENVPDQGHAGLGLETEREMSVTIMGAQGDLKGQMAEKTDEQLLDMLSQQDDWTPVALTAAKAELQKRGIHREEAARQPGGNSTGPPMPMEQSGECDDSQRVATYRGARRSLRFCGIGSIIWGLINIVVGASSMAANPVNGISCGDWVVPNRRRHLVKQV